MATPSWATGKRARKGGTPSTSHNASSTSLVPSNASSERLTGPSSSSHLPLPPPTVSSPPQEAPYLTHLQRHHGQITLSAPDNMGRRRQPDEQIVYASTSQDQEPVPAPKLKKKKKKVPSATRIQPDVLQAVINAGRSDVGATARPADASPQVVGGASPHPQSLDQLRSTRVDVFQDLEMPSEPLPAFSSPSPRPASSSDQSLTPERVRTPSPAPPDYAPRTPSPTSDLEEGDEPPTIVPKYSNRDLWDTMALAWEQDRERGLELDERIKLDQERRAAFEKVERLERLEREKGQSSAPVVDQLRTVSPPSVSTSAASQSERNQSEGATEATPAVDNTEEADTVSALPEDERRDRPSSTDSLQRLPPPVPPSRRVARTHSVYGGRRFVEAAERRIAAAQAKRAAQEQQRQVERQQVPQPASASTSAGPIQRAGEEMAKARQDEPRERMASDAARKVSVNSRRMMADAAERRMRGRPPSSTPDATEPAHEEAPPPIPSKQPLVTAQPPQSSSTGPPLPRRPPWTLLSNIPESDRESLAKPISPVRFRSRADERASTTNMASAAPRLPEVQLGSSLMSSFEMPRLDGARYQKAEQDDGEVPEEPTRRRHRPLPVPPVEPPADRVDAYTAIRDRERAAALATLTRQSYAQPQPWPPQPPQAPQQPTQASSDREQLGMIRSTSSSSSLLSVPAPIERPSSAASSFEQVALAGGGGRSASSSSASLVQGTAGRGDDESASDATVRSFRSPRDQVQQAQPQTGRQATQEYTDLDLLLARLERREQQGEQSNNYDDLLVIGEVLGEVDPRIDVDGQYAPDQRQQLGLLSRGGCSEEEIESLPVARVELVRRRVDKQGRVKLKLSVVGVRCVDCAICLSQFKVDEFAVVLPECLHVFHAKCIQSWLRHHRLCPKCRVDVFVRSHAGESTEPSAIRQS